MTEKRKIFSLAALNQSLERFIRDNFALKSFWVVAEVTKAQEKNGHHYFELADSKDGKRVAEMSANMWFSVYTRVNEKLEGELPKIFKQGNKVLVLVKIEYHTIFGLKLNIIDVDPSITYGEIEKRKKETIARLKKEKIYFLQKEKQIPSIAKRIALIGSPNTSGFRDFISELEGNSIYTNFRIKVFPASVQGEKALNEITKAIMKANLYDVDVIVIIRGGGSKMDLNVFNEYEIAEGICKSKHPVVTGIGHESDEVVADLVACRPEITPTAVAKFLYVRIGVFQGKLREAMDAVIRNSLGMIMASREEFNHWSKHLVHHTKNAIQTDRNALQDLLHKLHLGVREKIEHEKGWLSLQLDKAAGNAKNMISLKKSTELNVQLDKIEMLAKNRIDKERMKTENMNELLSLLNPLNLLEKGYTITTVDNIDLNRLDEVKEGMELKTLTQNKLIISTVNESRDVEN